MQGRQDRVLIPASIVFISSFIILWSAVGFNKNPFIWFEFVQVTEGKEILALLAALGITNIGLGYVCNIFFVTLMMVYPRARFIDFNNLIRAFGLAGNLCREQQKCLTEPLLAEFHLRLHSHAPQSLIDHCSRRNSAWYIAKTSSFAFAIGWIFAFCVIWNKEGDPLAFYAGLKSPTKYYFALTFFFIFIVFPIASWLQGTRWNREFWEVCWKWVTWDVSTHPLPDDLKKSLLQSVGISADTPECKTYG